MLVYNGAGMEGWAQQIVDGAAGSDLITIERVKDSRLSKERSTNTNMSTNMSTAMKRKLRVKQIMTTTMTTITIMAVSIRMSGWTR